MAPCFLPTTPLTLHPHSTPHLHPIPKPLLPHRSPTPRAELKDLIPGKPSGPDAREAAPLRYYVPRPSETYESRSFSTILPKTFEGQIDTIGVNDVDVNVGLKLRERESNAVEVDGKSSEAFLEYGRLMKEEREKSLKMLERKVVLEGRATCGPEEGKEKVSNFNEDLFIRPIYSLEYWNKQTYDLVPRRFGGPTA